MLRSVVAGFCFCAAACSFRPELVPAKGTNLATAKDNGITLLADASAWQGYPRDFEDLATPIAVELHNDGEQPVRFSLGDVSLTTDGGQVFAAWRVEDEQPKVQQPASQPVKTEPEAVPKTDADAVQGIDSDEDAELVPALYYPGADGEVSFARGGRGGGGFGRGSIGRGGGFGSRGGVYRPPSSTFRPAPSRPYVYRAPGVYRGPGVYRPPVYRQPGYRGPRVYIGPRVYGGIYSPYYGVPWWGGAYGWGYGGFGYGYGYGYASPDTPAYERDDVGRLAIRDATLDPGTHTSGFVYFTRATDDAQSLTLKVAVTSPASNEKVAELKTVFFVRR